MKAVVYLANRCHQCALVKNYIKSEGIDAKVYNVDLQNVSPPVEIFVYPALFMDEKLIAYGEDIIDYFNNASK